VFKILILNTADICQAVFEWLHYALVCWTCVKTTLQVFCSFRCNSCHVTTS
jgi:hypothetical protein